MTHNKDHWYDGWFYDALIAPNQDRMFGEIKNVIKPDSTIIDVGCGTGRFSFSVADKVQKVVAIDVSKKNIDKANKTLSKKLNPKVSFLHLNLSELVKKNQRFDCAVMTYVIHEVNPEERVALLKEMSQIADQIIIGDYLVPVKKGFWNILNEVVEYLAGKEHYTNFKNFVANNGLAGLTEKANLNIVGEIKNKPATSQILILQKSKKI
ncbi:MAG: class I SAM-dependent methyltransferase [Ignavibacterium sp.]|nr:class I SAM-dependent methyltransferase [Ignavibacterium sp.]